MSENLKQERPNPGINNVYQISRQNNQINSDYQNIPSPNLLGGKDSVYEEADYYEDVGPDFIPRKTLQILTDDLKSAISLTDSNKHEEKKYRHYSNLDIGVRAGVMVILVLGISGIFLSPHVIKCIKKAITVKPWVNCRCEDSMKCLFTSSGGDIPACVTETPQEQSQAAVSCRDLRPQSLETNTQLNRSREQFFYDVMAVNSDHSYFSVWQVRRDGKRYGEAGVCYHTHGSPVFGVHVSIAICTDKKPTVCLL